MDHHVFTNLSVYLSIAFPSMMVMILDWTALEISSLTAGFIGINSQASNALLLNM